MQFAVHCTAAVLAVALGPGASTMVAGETRAAARSQAVGQASTPPKAGSEADVEFTLFLSGTRAGTERVRMARVGSTWIISSTGQFGPPLNVTINRFASSSRSIR